MDKEAREHVIKVLERVARSRLNEVNIIATEKAKKRESEISEKKEVKAILGEIEKLKGQKRILAREITKKIKTLKTKLSEFGTDAGINEDYSGNDYKTKVYVDNYNIDRELRRKIEQKKDELILKVLCADTDKNLLKVVDELKNLKL